MTYTEPALIQMNCSYVIN